MPETGKFDGSLLSAIVEGTTDAIYVKDRDGRFLMINSAASKVFGKSPAELLGRDSSVLTIAPETAKRFLEDDQRILETGRTETFEVVSDLDNKVRTFHTTKGPVKDRDGNIFGIFGISRDISEKKRMEEAQKNISSLLRATLESTADGILAVDKEARKVITFNEQYLKMWKVPEPVVRIITTTQDDAPLLRHNAGEVADPEAFIGRVRELYQNPDMKSLDTVLLKDGRIFERHSIPQRIGEETVGRVWSFRDITKRQKTENELKVLASLEPLTGLPNRNSFIERLNAAIVRAESRQRIFAVLFIDLDHFKEINDRLGHIVGDLILKEVAKRLTTFSREGDYVSRLGGDEFVALLDDLANEEDSEAVAGKLLGLISEPFSIEDRTIRMTPSIGIALYPKNGRSREALLKSADEAMYRVKQSGRNAFQFANNQDKK